MTESYVRFDGLLGDDDRFEPLPGWETERPLRTPTGDTPYRLVVRDSDGTTLASVSPETQSVVTCAPGIEPERQQTRITGYVPVVEGATRVVLETDGRVLAERRLAAEPPAVDIVEFAVEEDTYHVQWESEATENTEIVHHVGVLADGVIKPRAFDVTGNSHEGSLTDVPGDEAARVLVVATDGLRSTTARTDPFPVADPGPTVSIQEPAPEASLPADHPISLVGSVLDSHGRARDPAGITWMIDGETVATDTNRALAGPLVSGEHTVTLVYERPDTESEERGTGRDERTVTVQSRTERQQWYREVMPDDRLPSTE